MSRRRVPYKQFLVQPSSATPAFTSRGNSVLDVLANSRGKHYNAYCLSWWDQPTLKCYSTTPYLKAAHSVLANASTVFPSPAITKSTAYNAVSWSLVAGMNTLRVIDPGGEPAVSMLKICDDQPVGSVWGIRTTALGSWEGDMDASLGEFGTNRSIGAIVRLGQGDQSSPDTAMDNIAPTSQSGYVSQENAGKTGDVRVMVGNLWSVKLHGDGSAPTFEKKVGRNNNGGLKWTVLHTFAGAQPEPVYDLQQWMIFFTAIGGRIAVSVAGRDIASTSYVYTETDPRSTKMKVLSIPHAPVMVTGISGGGPRWVGIRRIEWAEQGGFSNTMKLTDASVFSAVGSPPTSGDVQAGALHLPQGPYAGGVQGASSIGFQTAMLDKLTLEYQAHLYATSDRRESPCMKWTFYGVPPTANAGSASYIDYGPAITRYEEHGPEPDFSGVTGTRGSDGYVDIEFDAYELDNIAAANSSNWRTDLGPYQPATWVLGNYMCNDGPGGDNSVTISSNARLFGYLDKPSSDNNGINQKIVRRTLVDPMIRLKEPAGFIDDTWLPLDVALTGTANGVFYGWQAIQYILSKAIDPVTASALKVYMPTNWPTMGVDLSTAATGQLPSGDKPVWNPPHGKYAAEWLPELAALDFAALFWCGNTPIYGQYDLVVAGQPTFDVYDTPGATDASLNFMIVHSKFTFDTHHDFNDWVVWGAPAGGVSDAQTSADLGVPIVSARATDYSSVQASWQRTKAWRPSGVFHDQNTAELMVRTAKALSGHGKIATTCVMEFDYALPEVFWGCTFNIHAPSDPDIDGKSMRVIEVDHTGTGSPAKVKCSVRLVEIV